jgi:hypothetical protein
MNFQQYALLLIGIWLFAVFVRFRRSIIVLIGGLLVVGLSMSIALIGHLVSLQDLGLGIPIS